MLAAGTVDPASGLPRLRMVNWVLAVLFHVLLVAVVVVMRYDSSRRRESDPRSDSWSD
jgi:hypothetical protein